ncbi:hypothetical protein A9Q81_10090 [Gammaproteobacteria bacterium 42_54_T18]|nr:hypothetical protein A9Q81_10090 [Gammaproteobacteria bacterium 42_54_T18]
MNEIEAQLLDFKMLLESICNDNNYKNHKPYLLLSLTESYFEYISKILNKKISCNMKQQTRLIGLLKKNEIESEVFNIMDKTRKLRNGFSHDLSYFPSDKDIIEYHKIVSVYSEQKIGSLNDKEDKVYSLTSAIIQGYAVVSSRVSDNLNNNLKELIIKINAAKL